VIKQGQNPVHKRSYLFLHFSTLLVVLGKNIFEEIERKRKGGIKVVYA